METRLRLLLVQNELPRPQAQVPIYGQRHVFPGRPDLYYEQARLGIEYDGEYHRDRLISDNQRQNRLLEVGVRLLRYTSVDLFTRPMAIVAEVRAALSLPTPGSSVYKSTSQTRE